MLYNLHASEDTSTRLLMLTVYSHVRLLDHAFLCAKQKSRRLEIALRRAKRDLFTRAADFRISLVRCKEQKVKCFITNRSS